MNNDKLKQFIIPIFLILVALICMGGAVKLVIDSYQNYSPKKEELAQKTALLEEKKEKLEKYKKEAAEKLREEQENEKQGKPFYKPVMQGLDSESIIAGEFAEVLEIVRDNKIKVRAVKYDYQPSDDAFVSNASDKYNVARLNMEMIATYTSYASFLKGLYKHEHFIDIESVEIVPYKKNKAILLINLKLKLYSKK